MTPTIQKYYAPTFSVSSGGLLLPIDVTKSIKQVTIDDRLDGADIFSLDIDNHDMRWLDEQAGIFEEGSEISITIGYANGPTTSLLGEVTSLQVDFPATGVPTLTVTGKDLSHRLMNGENNHNYKNMRDSDIVSIIALRNFLVPMVQPTMTLNEYLEQKSQSDYHFIKGLAKKNGFEIWVEDRLLYFTKYRDLIKAKISLEWGKSLKNFRPKLSTAKQLKDVEVRGWDPKLKRAIVGTAKQNKISTQAKKVIMDKSINTQKIADDFAGSVLKERMDKYITGTGSCIGMPELRTGMNIDLLGLSPKFSGEYYVTSSKHTLGNSGYTTSFSVRKEL